MKLILFDERGQAWTSSRILIWFLYFKKWILLKVPSLDIAIRLDSGSVHQKTLK